MKRIDADDGDKYTPLATSSKRSSIPRGGRFAGIFATCGPLYSGLMIPRRNSSLRSSVRFRTLNAR
jgi:hypothetical protein